MGDVRHPWYMVMIVFKGVVGDGALFVGCVREELFWCVFYIGHLNVSYCSVVVSSTLLPCRPKIGIHVLVVTVELSSFAFGCPLAFSVFSYVRKRRV